MQMCFYIFQAQVSTAATFLTLDDDHANGALFAVAMTTGSGNTLFSREDKQLQSFRDNYDNTMF